MGGVLAGSSHCGSDTDAEKLELGATVEEEMRTATQKTGEVRVRSSEGGKEGILSLPTAWVEVWVRGVL